jgi:hypothetical protein
LNTNNIVLLALNPFWITGFTDGEDSFSIKTFKNNETGKIKFQLVFRLGQLSIDASLIHNIHAFFGFGRVSTSETSGMTTFITSSLSDSFKIIEHFDNYPLQSKKSKDFEDWKKVAIMIKNKEHLTSEGMDIILIIKGGMNRNRII